jgi:hypothetical protein
MMNTIGKETIIKCNKKIEVWEEDQEDREDRADKVCLEGKAAKIIHIFTIT